MNFYQENRARLLNKAHDKYHNKGGNEKAALYYRKNKGTIKERERKRYKSMTNIERNEKIKKSSDRYYKLKSQYKE